MKKNSDCQSSVLNPRPLVVIILFSLSATWTKADVNPPANRAPSESAGTRQFVLNPAEMARANGLLGFSRNYDAAVAPAGSITAVTPYNIPMHSVDRKSGLGRALALPSAFQLSGLQDFVSLCPPSPVSDKCPIWATTYDFTQGKGNEGAIVSILSSSGDRLYVTGTSYNSATNGQDYATIAYDAANGNQLWVSRLEAAPNSTSIADSIALSPDGSRVYVTGQRDLHFGPLESSYGTVAYDATTGQQLWAASYHAPFSSSAFATAVGVSPDGRAVYVTGQSPGGFGNQDYATIAYDAATGQQLWLTHYKGISLGIGRALQVGRDGRRVYVTGATVHMGEPISYGTVAYDASTGQQIWEARYIGPNPDNNTDNEAFDLALSPDGSRVYVTGTSGGGGIGKSLSFATVAYDAVTGQQLWAARYAGLTDPSDNIATAIRVSPDGNRVYITGYSALGPAFPPPANFDYATVAYDAATGSQLWLSRFDSGGDDVPSPSTLAISPDGSQIFVTGFSGPNRLEGTLDFATLAYSAQTGGRLWLARYNNSTTGIDGGRGLSLSPDGSRLYVTGKGSDPTGMDGDYVTLAYGTGLALVQLNSVVSRKTHGNAGTFDIDLPLTGPRGIECRSGGANRDYTIIFKFANDLTSVDGASASATKEGGGNQPVTATGSINPADRKEYIANLTGVPNAQVITVSLTNVTDSAGNSSNGVSASMGVLLGDVNANANVSNADVALVKAQVGAPVTSSNFRNDVNTNGTLSNGDVSVTKAQVGTLLP